MRISEINSNLSNKNVQKGRVYPNISLEHYDDDTIKKTKMQQKLDYFYTPYNASYNLEIGECF